jgi:galactose-1-phosphate uridylyltransferase
VKGLVANITFERIQSEVRFHNPLRDFAEDLHPLEIRKDPLLGDVSIHNPYLKDKAKAFFGECDQGLVKQLVEESGKNCFFCGERVEQATPKFTSDFIAEGRLRVGEAVLFPNLFSLGTYHPVVCLCKAHFLRLSEFHPGVLADGLTVAQEFLKIVYHRDPSAAFAVVTANYLFPAGASLVHPHLQMLITPVPYSYHGRLIEAGNSYFREHGSSYFTDLIDQEREGPRHVARRGRWNWLASFSPLGNNEVMAIHDSVPDYGLLSEMDVKDLAHGISRVLSFYETLGHLSFNYAAYSVKNHLAGEDLRCIFKIITRQNLYPNYRNDDYFLQKLLQSELIITPPEELAVALKGHF